MVTYIVRRLFTAALILLGASFLVYQLTALSGDPLHDLRESNAQQRAADRAGTALLDLDTPAPLRYFKWLAGAAKCLVPFVGSCDSGYRWTANRSPRLWPRHRHDILLVTASAVLAILIGITLGIVTALRQYSTLDYGVTFMAFLFFSLPVFWVAVLLKEFGAIGFNDFLRNPQIPLSSIRSSAWSVRPWWYVVCQGRLPEETAAMAGIGFAAVTPRCSWSFSVTQWFKTPGSGLVVIAIAGVGIAFA